MEVYALTEYINHHHLICYLENFKMLRRAASWPRRYSRASTLLAQRQSISTVRRVATAWQKVIINEDGHAAVNPVASWSFGAGATVITAVWLVWSYFDQKSNFSPSDDIRMASLKRVLGKSSEDALEDAELTEYYGIPNRLETPTRWMHEVVTQAKRKNVLLLCGPQGSGKTELVKRLVQVRPRAVYIGLRKTVFNKDNVRAVLLTKLGYVNRVIDGADDWDDFATVLPHLLRQLQAAPDHRIMWALDINAACTAEFDSWTCSSSAVVEIKTPETTQSYNKRDVPLIVIDDIQKLVRNNEVMDGAIDILGVLIEIQQARLADVILVTSEPAVIPVLQRAVSGMRARLDKQLLSWWSKDELHAPVMKFLACDKQSADHVLDKVGGNLKHIYDVRVALQNSDATVSDAPSRSFTLTEVKRAVAQISEGVHFDLINSLQGLDQHVFNAAIELLKELNGTKDGKLQPSRKFSQGMWLIARTALLDAAVLRVGDSGLLEMYTPAILSVLREKGLGGLEQLTRKD
eukprot:TRINITY_DN11973_c0_g1_i1.p1 TRINITY_DN11973_c0_g1~~TRINITY_DN11973_c0_g1_i1.p1  ORF type:complete len:519 (+),score=93.12 TRINITY_DN11973_c0_g1_i1:113-1669(+)